VWCNKADIQISAQRTPHDGDDPPRVRRQPDSFEAMNRATRAPHPPVIDRVFAFSAVHDAFDYFMRASRSQVVVTGS